MIDIIVLYHCLASTGATEPVLFTFHVVYSPWQGRMRKPRREVLNLYLFNAQPATRWSQGRIQEEKEGGGLVKINVFQVIYIKENVK